ncbi:MAG TPA: hypothetical protein VJ864_08970, partial [Candidatus Binatia bacterium]|nr:hypothetical protein [Candidatus Binatia bacterium]
MEDADEEKLLRAVTLQNARAVLQARERAEKELLKVREELEQSNSELAQRVAELQKANREVQESRRAALNLMEDAVQSRRAMERLNAELHESEERLARELTATRQLQSASALLIEGGDTQALYKKIVDAAVVIMHSDCASMQ